MGWGGDGWGGVGWGNGYTDTPIYRAWYQILFLSLRHLTTIPPQITHTHITPPHNLGWGGVGMGGVGWGNGYTDTPMYRVACILVPKYLS